MTFTLDLFLLEKRSFKEYLYDKHCIQLLTVDVDDLMVSIQMNDLMNFYHHQLNLHEELFLMLYEEINVYQ